MSADEPCFQGHFPGQPIFPGVLVLETLAQASGLLVFRAPELCPQQDSLYMLVGVDRARFKRPVEPGDRLLLDVELKRMRQNCATFDAAASVDGETAASAEIMCMFKPLPESG